MIIQHRKKEGGSMPPNVSGSPPINFSRTSAPHAHGHQQHVPRRTVSPSIDVRRIAQASAAAARIIANKNAAQAARQKDKFVPLLIDGDDSPPEGEEQQQQQQQQHTPASLDSPLPLPDLAPTIFEDLPALVISDSKRGRITLYCTAEAYERKRLEATLKSAFHLTAVKSYPDVFYLEYFKGSDTEPGGDVFFFDYGVVAMWGLSKAQEDALVHTIVRQVQEQPLPPSEVEVDEFQFNYSSQERPHIQNDSVTLPRRTASDHRTKLAISYALAQSTKLSIYEQRVVDIVSETRHLPEDLALTGRVNISGHDIAKLIGKVFIHKAAVNLLSSVLDTPEFFWRAPDSFQVLYERCCEYLELDARVEVVNSRFTVLQEMLDMLRDHQNNFHSARLEWIVIWLIVVEVVVGLFELLGLFGILGNDK